MGRAAFFIRTFGCPLKCSWCDSAGTWHPDWIPERIERLSTDELVVRVTDTAAEFVVVTGGEPTIHDLSELTRELRRRKIPVHIETSGSFEIRGDFSWITVSPKWAKLPRAENLERADEIKIIVEDAETIDRWRAELGAFFREKTVWLHPEWSRRDDPVVLNAISCAVKTFGKPFRVGYQLHRLYNVDSLDPNSRPAVPLGGNVALGR